ncbi:MAG TPA: hypothetical protein EYP90_13715 [Chromatiaceae bacterium]|nr:hypothetical protein [Chromatiaceae bacterium]
MFSQTEYAVLNFSIFSIAYGIQKWRGIPAPLGHLDFSRSPCRIEPLGSGVEKNIFCAYQVFFGYIGGGLIVPPGGYAAKKTRKRMPVGSN